MDSQEKMRLGCTAESFPLSVLDPPKGSAGVQDMPQRPCGALFSAGLGVVFHPNDSVPTAPKAPAGCFRCAGNLVE